MVSGGPVFGFCGPGFPGVNLEWLYSRWAFYIPSRFLFPIWNVGILSFKNEYAKSISTMALSRAFVGTRLGSFWQHSLTTAVSKFGAPWIGNWRLRFENLSRILLGVPFSDDSGELGNFLESELIIGSSWSPDGAHITASNATNNKGFVFIAAVIARNSWTSEISLVGHENTVEVAVSVCTMGAVAVNMNAKFPRHTIHTYSFVIQQLRLPLPTSVRLSLLVPMTARCPFGRQSPLGQLLWPRKSSRGKSWTSVGEVFALLYCRRVDYA